MTNLILTLTFLFALLSSSAQSLKTDTAQYKDYKACAECFDKWGKSNGYEPNNNSEPVLPILSKRNNPVANEGKKIVMMIVGVFTAAIGIVAYNKITKQANEIQ